VWFVCHLWLLLLLLLDKVLCEGGQEVGAFAADDESCWVGAAVDDELQEVGRQGRGEEEGR
jgi:hypothetical protein